MASLQPFTESLRKRDAQDPKFRAALLAEAVECFLNGEVSVAKTMLRDYIKATMGFEALGAEIDKHPASLKRMLSPTGNPTATNFVALIKALSTQRGARFQVKLAR